MKQPAYIFDIDGTLADCSHRLGLINGNIKYWEEFYGACKDDQPIADVCSLAIDFIHYMKRDIIFLTGRPERVRRQTNEWLVDKLGAAGCSLYMRKDGDHRPDYEVKREIYEQKIKDKYQILGVFEDRQQCVDMWRSLGLTCFQVAKRV